MSPWRSVRGSIVALVVLTCFVEPAAMADEIVVTTDGRKLLLRSDGTFEFLSRLEPAVIGRALATAHEWAQDQTLIAYCFRTSPERELMARNFASERDEGLARLRRAGATEQQLHQVATRIAENYRPASPSNEDKAMTEACAAKDVERSVYIFNGVGRILSIRAPFNALK